MNACLLPLVWIDMSAFTERLRSLRELRQLTQTRLAELLEINPRVYNRWERGTAIPQFDTVVRIADILQVSLDELAGRSPSISEPKIHNTALLNLYEQVDTLPDASQQALVLVIDGMVKQAQVEKVVGKRAGKR
jgi:transcriptional regulator with XRE-family HTH domain